MDRRSFFKSLAALAGAVSIAPNIFIPKLGRVAWKPISNVWVPADYYGMWVWIGPPTIGVLDMPFSGTFPYNAGETVRQPMIFKGFGEPTNLVASNGAIYIDISKV